MPIDLTRDDVRALASPRIFGRGDRYQKKGRVLECALTDDAIIGRVQGSRRVPYEVRIELYDGTVELAVCTCPFDWEDTCKHAVAVLLSVVAGDYLDEIEREGGSEDGEVGSDFGALRPGISSPDLQRWAGERGLESLLDLPVHAAFATSDVGSVGYSLPRVPLREVVTAQDVGSRYRWPYVTKAQQRAAVKLLIARADDVQRGRVEESARVARWTRPVEAPLSEVFDRLLALRSELRQQAHPRPTDRLGMPRFVVEPDPPAFFWIDEGGRAFCAGGERSPSARVVLGVPGQAPTVTCGCRTPFQERPCEVKLGALDATIDALGLPEQAERAAEILRVLTTPLWERDLAALDIAMAAIGPPPLECRGDEAELGWRIKEARGGLDLEPVACRPKKRGHGYLVRGLRSWEVDDERWRLPLAADRRVLNLVTHKREWPPDDDRLERALLHLVGHPRVFFGPPGRAAQHLAVRRSHLELRVSAAGEGGEVTLMAGVEGHVCPIADVAGRLDGFGLVTIDLEAAVCWVTPIEPHIRALLCMLSARENRYPTEGVAALLSRLVQLSDIAPVRIDPALGALPIKADPRPILRMEMDTSDGLLITLLARPVPDLSGYPPGDGPVQVFTVHDEGVVYAERDLEAERSQAEALAARLDLKGSAAQAIAPFSWSVASLDEALELLTRIQGVDDVTVEWADGRRRAVSSVGTDDLRLRIDRRREWFHIGGGVRIDGVDVPLTDLLDALRGGRRFVAVSEGQWVRIDAALRDRLAPLAKLAPASKKQVAVSQYATPLLAELADGDWLGEASSWYELRARIDEASTMDIPVPAGLTATLRDYQVTGYRWLARLAHWASGACLADDMGLGKTVQAIALLLRRAKQGPAVVIAPTTVGFNWVRELERFAPSLRAVLFRGRAHRDRLSGLAPGDVVVTSYDLAARYLEPFQAIEVATLVLDESQAIKNPATQRARAIFSLEAGFTVALTGTPVENRTSELWSLFRAIAPGLLGSARQFKATFSAPIERDGDRATRELLASLVRPFILRRLKSEVARELPPRTDIFLDVELSPAERRLYDEVRLAALHKLTQSDASVPRQQRFEVLAALTRLRQLACHPKLVQPESTVSSSKLAVLNTLLRELRDEGHRALVFSQFTSLLAHVRDALDREGLTYRYLDGRTPAAKRRAEVDAFQDGQADVFLLSLKAGGTGINLTAADYVIHLDPWWNPAVEDQATDRAHRIGQDRPVNVYRLIARDTIEEAVVALHAEKRELVSALLDGTGSSAALTVAELVALMGRGAGERPLPESEPDAGDDDPPVTESPPEAAPSTDPLARLERLLEASLRSGRLRSEQSVSSYLRVAQRLEAFFVARDLSVTAEAMASSVADYVAEVRAGRWSAPTSDRKLAPTVGRWWERALTDSDAPEIPK